MQHTQSLCENNRFRALYARGKSAAAPSLVVYARKNRLKTISRMGITCSVKLGGAVQRNRMRRRLREAYRLQEGQFAPGYDIVIVARSRCMKCSFDALQRDMMELFSKLGLLKKWNEKSGTCAHTVLQKAAVRAETGPYLPLCSHLLSIRLGGD